MRQENIKLLDTHMIDCQLCENLVNDFVDGNISESDRSLCDEHISGCEYCSALYAEYELLLRAASKLAEVSMPSGVGDRLRARLNAECGLDLPTKVRPLSLAK